VPPRFLVGAGLVVWGWQTGLLPLGLVAAVLLEGAVGVRARWDLGRSDFNRISDLSSVLFVGGAVYLGATRDWARGLTMLIQWLPMIVLPVVVAQVYSAQGGVDPRIFFWSQRKRADEDGTAPARLIDLRIPYLGLCLLGASAANDRSWAFYVAGSALVGWALWPVRSRRVSAATWAASLALVVALGGAAHLGLNQLQRVIEASAFEWIAEWLRRDVDPFRASTTLGQIGSLKLSDRIVLRVVPDGPPMPLLVREASYNVWSAPAWLAVDSSFTAVTPEADATTWRVAPDRPAARVVTVSAPLRRGRGVLPLPSGAFRLERLTAVRLSRNPLGVVKVDEGLPLATYRAVAGADTALDAPPGPLDLEMRGPTGRAVAALAGELGLTGRPPAAAVAAVRELFARDFRYTTYQDEVRLGDPIEDFLRRRRAGHCEYFASATVHLLRAADVPARYATGYAAQEWSAWERAFVVRTRHAHAWALAWVDGAWRDVDTTPSSWDEEESSAAASLWRPLLDFWSWLTYAFDRWRVGDGRDLSGTWLGWLVVPLVAILVWRIYRRTRRAAPAAAPASAVAGAVAGADSELYLVERRLAASGFPRQAGEPLARWAARVAPAAGPGGVGDALGPLVSLHYRYRFDPAGLAPADRDRLRAAARSLLDRLPAG